MGIGLSDLTVGDEQGKRQGFKTRRFLQLGAFRCCHVLHQNLKIPTVYRLKQLCILFLEYRSFYTICLKVIFN